MLFLLTVVLVAVRPGRAGGDGLAGERGAVRFPLRCRRVFARGEPRQYLVTFAVMLAVSLLVGHLTRQAARARHGRRRPQASPGPFRLTRALAGAMSVEQVAEAVAGFLRDNWGAECVLLLAGDGDRR